MNSYRLIRPLLYLLDAERAHDLVLGGLRRASRSPAPLAAIRALYRFDDPRLEVTLFGRRLSNPLGVAAGLDKNGVAIPALDALGFGFVEVGTVTPRPQPGNQRPRVFRLAEDQALVNRMGFPSGGVEAVERNLDDTFGRFCFGLNVGPNKDRVEQAAEEGAAVIRRLIRYAPTYIVVNVSSPNTARLRDLQGKDALHQLLSKVIEHRPPSATEIPILIKIAPDLSDAELDDVLQVASDLALAGIVATNTTISRPPDLRGRHKGEQGGLSGRPLSPLTDRIIQRIHEQTQDKLVVIAAGGIFTAADALAKIAAGATAVQIYTGLIYEGPGMVKRIKREMVAVLDRNGIASIEELRGTGAELRRDQGRST